MHHIYQDGNQWWTLSFLFFYRGYGLGKDRFLASKGDGGKIPVFGKCGFNMVIIYLIL